MDAGALAAWPFACRESELVEAEVSGAAGRAVVLIGEAGVGKSRLLAELVERAEHAGDHTIRVFATRSLSAVPLGVFAGVLPLRSGHSAPRLDVLQRALQALCGDRSFNEVTLAVDDAHLLDDTSAGLVGVAAQAGCRVLATVRGGEPCPDAVQRLWKDDRGYRLDLRPLDDEQVGEVLEHALGAPIESRTRHRLAAATRGNLLFLRELVRSAVANGSLVERVGVWTWTGSAVNSPGVQELVLDRVRALDDATRELVDLLAIGEPLDPGVVRDLCSSEAIDDAEHRGLITLVTIDARPAMHLVHPLYADVLRDELGTGRRASLSRRLADALVALSADDALRIAMLRLDAGVECDPGVTALAARQALALTDLALAERLARHTLASTATVEATLALAQILYWSGGHEEIVELLGSGVLEGAPPAVVADGAMYLASALLWGMGDLAEAERWLAWGADAAGPPYATEIAGQRSLMLMFAGKATDALEIGRAVVADQSASSEARLRAYGGILASAAVCGRLTEFEASFAIAFGLRRTGPGAASALGPMMVGWFIARLFGGDLAEFDDFARALHEEAVRRVDDPFHGVWVFLLGRSALAQGRLGEAVPRLREAAAVLRERDTGSVLPWALASLAQALGMTGDARGSGAALQEYDGVPRHAMGIIDIDVELGRAWAACARGERSIAIAHAIAVGRRLLVDGHTATGALALHDAIRLGAVAADIVDDLDRAARAAEGPLVAAMADHARALASADVDGALNVATAFDSMGMVLLAAEAATNASRMAGSDGRRGVQREAVVRAGALLAVCGPVLTPMLEPVTGRQELASLTRREQEIALMASRGLSKREIAETLFLSTRTVGNHINHIYAKLGISSRDELKVVLG